MIVFPLDTGLDPWTPGTTPAGAEMMKNLVSKSLLLTIPLFLFTTIAPCEGVGWVGVEFDSNLTVIADPYEVTGYDGDGGMWEFSGRVTYQESIGAFDAELHWLATALGTFGQVGAPLISQGSPFRVLDMEDIHEKGDRVAILSEVDRLSLAHNTPDVRLRVGRQAITWGESYYYNIGDLFGAFPITETNRLHKPGIDALSATFTLGPFSDLSLVLVPSDDHEDSAAGRLILPVGEGSLTITMGSILETRKGGAGYTVDVKGTKLYGTWLLSAPDEGEEFTEAVLGAERQIGSYTHLIGELYYNGWGADDANGYADLQLTERYLEDRALVLGKLNSAIEVSRQVSPLLILTPAVFANLSDGSALFRLDGTYSVSDFTTVTGGVFLGLGERPDGGDMQSEHGNVPPTLYVEVVQSL